MSTALTQIYRLTIAWPRVVSEKESLLEGESGPTPAETTLPTPYQQDRSWPSLEDGERRPDKTAEMMETCVLLALYPRIQCRENGFPLN